MATTSEYDIYDKDVSGLSLTDLAKQLIYARAVVEVENQRVPAPEQSTNDTRTQTQQGGTRPNSGFNKTADFVRDNQQVIILGFTGLLAAGLVLNAIK